MSSETQTCVYCYHDDAAVDSARLRARLRSRSGHALLSTSKIFLPARSRIRAVRHSRHDTSHSCETVVCCVSVTEKHVDTPLPTAGLLHLVHGEWASLGWANTWRDWPLVYSPSIATDVRNVTHSNNCIVKFVEFGSARS